ncbi:MAG: FAD-dependent oxidoreductase [Flavobacteriaceae bacterium]
MNLSYWEYKTWLSNIDFTIVGSGIVGLNCALALKKRYPQAKILVLEKGILPQGASTKNAGFACFGSISEIISDLRAGTQQEVVDLVQRRWKGIQLLRKNLGDSAIDFQQYGGHELFLDKHEELYLSCLDSLNEVNLLLQPIFGKEAFRTHSNTFRFKRIQENYITNSFEAQLDTGRMMMALLSKVQERGVLLLNSVTLQGFSEQENSVSVTTSEFDFCTQKLFIATNGFTSQVLNEEVTPARAQVLITSPIPNLQIKGTFHFDEGYYFFRNIDNRILFGGGRNLDIKGEQTSKFGHTKQIQDRLEELLGTTILPKTKFVIERRWSGIMGLGPKKKPIVKQVSQNVYCGVRMGGMGIAIGSLIGQDLADLI